MKKFLLSLAALVAVASSAMAAVSEIYLNPGDDIQKALDEIDAGGTIYLHAGTYYPPKRLLVPGKDGANENNRTKLFAAGDGDVIIDGSNTNPENENEFKQSRCIYLPHFANYWHIKGIIFQNAKDNGMKLEGSYNIIEQCVFRWNNDTGLQMGMYKSFNIEEYTSEHLGKATTPSPEFNPDFKYCRGNKILNCDSYYNYDYYNFDYFKNRRTNDKREKYYGDDGGDADGFACKLFPGPGNEFYGCRAWNNSDDNWDLFDVFFPVVISNCWAWDAGRAIKDKPEKNLNPELSMLPFSNESCIGNGNGIKLGGDKDFIPSIGAHVVTNCISFNNPVDGFDRNNANEKIYLFNNTAWGNGNNVDDPSIFIQENNMFFPYTEDNLNKFQSLDENDAKAKREADGSLPNNGFARLKKENGGERWIDAGTLIENYPPERRFNGTYAGTNNNSSSSNYNKSFEFYIGQVTAPNITIPYFGSAPDWGAREYRSVTLDLLSQKTEQTVPTNTEISPVKVQWGDAATDVQVTGLVDGLKVDRDFNLKTATVTGVPKEGAVLTFTTLGGDDVTSLTHKITVVSNVTLKCTSENANQSVRQTYPIEDIVFEAGGDATISVSELPKGLEAKIEDLKLTISGSPTSVGEYQYTVTASEGVYQITETGTITVTDAVKYLGGSEDNNWYHIQNSLDDLPDDLKGIISLEQGDQGDQYPTVWNPEYKENGRDIPDECTYGAINVERGGAVVWTLPSLKELKLNLHFTGNRDLHVKWKFLDTRADEDGYETWTSSYGYSQGTYTGWDLMQQAGIKPTDRPIEIKFVNLSSNTGGIRIYDFLLGIADPYSPNNDPTGIKPSLNNDDNISIYMTDGAIILNREDVAAAVLYSIDGRAVSNSISSSIVPLMNVARGKMYILQVQTNDGSILTKKLIIK